MGLRPFLFFTVIFICIGCSGFAYKYYQLKAVSYDGTLEGKEPKDDKPFSDCKPDDQNKGKCVVVFSDEFFRFKQDFEDCQSKLIKCEQGK